MTSSNPTSSGPGDRSVIDFGRLLRDVRCPECDPDEDPSLLPSGEPDAGLPRDAGGRPS